MSGIDLLSPPSPSLSQAAQEAAAVVEGMELEESVRRLGFMAGVKSNHRNLKSEDEAYARSMAGNGLDDSAGDAVTKKPDDEMDIMAARDVTINYGQPPQAPAVAQPASATPAPITQAVQAAAPAAMGLATKAILGAALLGSGAAVPLAINALMPKTPATVAAPYNPAEFDLLPPDPPSVTQGVEVK